MAQAPVAPVPTYRSRVAIAPVIGAPDGVARQLSQQLAMALEAKQIGVSKPGEASDFTVRGYVVAAKEKTNTKVSYIWDINDGTGKRINRVTGEEAAASGADKDPWQAVTPQIVQSIADRTATSLASALPATTGSVAVASAAPGAAPAATPRTSATTTASIPQSGATLQAVVPSVTGAPGDGAQSLAAAMQRELTRSGIQLGAAGTTAYRVEGKVQLGQGKDGKQPIQIEWQVKDPRGNKLGTVSQKNDIPQGSLDGAWGQTAEVAAAAAAQGVIKLLPQSQTQTN
ncbi:MAG: hypothetical protein ACOYLQ_12340 [Hyphomicrobiaceae bacterium]